MKEIHIWKPRLFDPMVIVECMDDENSYTHSYSDEDWNIIEKKIIREFLEKVELRGNGNFTHGVSGYELCEILLKELESED